MTFAKNEEVVKALRDAHHIENEYKAKFDSHYGKLDNFNLAG